MITYIGFSTKTHKIYARVICRKYKHCAPVTVYKNRAIIYQFTKPDKIVAIPIKKRDLNILQYHGWKFIRYDAKIAPEKALKIHAITCVQFTKRVFQIQNIFVQTPDALLKHLNTKIKNARYQL